MSDDVIQVLLGWKYGDCVDEKAKIHPQLRTYKALTEKVENVGWAPTNPEDRHLRA